VTRIDSGVVESPWLLFVTGMERTRTLWPIGRPVVPVFAWIVAAAILHVESPSTLGCRG
jgi:hypothetical protein